MPNWKENSMLCGEFAEFDIRHPERNDVHNVIALPMRDKLLDYVARGGDAWASEVQNGLHGCID